MCIINDIVFTFANSSIKGGGVEEIIYIGRYFRDSLQATEARLIVMESDDPWYRPQRKNGHDTPKTE